MAWAVLERSSAFAPPLLNSSQVFRDSREQARGAELPYLGGRSRDLSAWACVSPIRGRLAWVTWFGADSLVMPMELRLFSRLSFCI